MDTSGYDLLRYSDYTYFISFKTEVGLIPVAYYSLAKNSLHLHDFDEMPEDQRMNVTKEEYAVIQNRNIIMTLIFNCMANELRQLKASFKLLNEIIEGIELYDVSRSR